MPPRSAMWALLRRECYRFLRLASQTIVPPIVTTLLFILIFGYSLGSQISELHGFPYIVFILPGLAAQGVIINAYTNTATSLYMARFDHTIENWLSSPLSAFQLVVALISGGVARGMIVGLLTIGVAYFLIDLPLVHPFGIVLWTFLLAVVFACGGIVSGLYADGWDHLATVTNFVLTPITYLGGVFYSVQLLPEPWRSISRVNPVWYCIDGMRAMTLGASDIPWWRTLLLITALSLAGVGLCWYLLKIGWRVMK